MRAGNSITRKYFETITGVITGSSMDNKYMRNFTLFFSGFKGENYLDDNIWMYKTHVPFRPLDGVPYMQNKAIVCVRNPLDICVSAFTLRMTGGHSLNCENNISKDFPDIWSLFLKESIALFNNFYDFWIQVANAKKIPVYFFRYEDLITAPAETYTKIFEFILN